jgi:hypothetical protein
MSDPISIAANQAAALLPNAAAPAAQAQAQAESVPAVVLTNPALADQAPVSLALGTMIGATLVTPAAGGNATAGARYQLRFGGATVGTGAASVTGTVAASPAGDTILETSLGTLTLDRKLALALGATIEFEPLATSAPAPEEVPIAQSSGWPTLDQVLDSLDKSAPELAQQLRAQLSPTTGPALAGTLAFLAGALESGNWPGTAVTRALTAAGQDRLRTKLGEDLTELRRLGANAATGEWRVLSLPLLVGASIQPVRLYLRRNGSKPRDPGGSRFVLETEMSRLGTLQLDGLVRGNRLDLVLRSHTPLPQEVRTEATALFHRTTAASGYHGDILFSTVASFTVAPLTELRRHVAVQI